MNIGLFKSMGRITDAPQLQVLFTAMCLLLTFGFHECQADEPYLRECRNTSTCPCCMAGTCPPDRSGQCGGKCIDTFYGGKCWNKCPGNCARCQDAPVGGGVATCTQCKEGYYLTSDHDLCQLACSTDCKTCEESPFRCTSCRPGYYHTSSFECAQCNAACVNCTSKSKCTSCNYGYFLDEGTCVWCHHKSEKTCICSNGCLKDDCLESDSRCVFGCKANHTSSGNFNCDICDAGVFGIECDNICPSGCQSTCDRKTGVCTTCQPELYGDYCNNSCPNGCATSCNRTTGDCFSCSGPYHGNDCTLKCQTSCKECTITDGTCTSCVEGHYGADCDKNCSQNCLLPTCDKDNGSCGCKPGFEGDMCQNSVTTRKTTTEGILRVVTEKNIDVGSSVGGTVSGVVIIGVLGLVAVLLYRRRFTHKYVRYEIQFDSYKLDPSLIDVLEENDEFDPTYFTGTVDETKKPCGKLPVKELAKFVDSHDEGFYQEEFLRLPRGLIKSYEDAKKDENIVKNRYTGIYPYDEHRVKLLPPGSDFINACYMDGFKRKKEYIASLGPTVKAMEHFRLFWRMVWQEKTDVIVMVTNLMEGQSMKCEQYWPDIATSSTYDDITVTSLKEDFYAEFVIRTLSLTRDGEQRNLHHVHFTAWPDKRVPDELTSLIELRQKVKTIKPVLGGPTIVHCSAGIGRTGTYIALDILIHQGKAQKALDIFDWVTRMREQRTSMVQTWQQYEYLHHALVHALTYHCEPIKAKKFQHFMDKADNKRMNGLFKQLNEKSERMSESEREAREMNRGLEGMNRDGADIPGSQHRPFLHLDKKYGESNYINAVYLNSFTVKNRFLIAQSPLPETVKDFLTLITQVTCSCIVSMDPPGLRDQTIGEYYPITPGDVFAHPSYVFEVEAQELDTNPGYSLRRLTVHFNKRSGSTSRTVYHFQCQHWPQGNQVPNVRLFLQLVQDVEAMADRDMDRGPVLVHCLNAARRSGLFCAVSNLIQKMRLEGEVSVINTLRQVKVRRPLAIPNKDQYVFCYQSVLQFVKTEAENNDENVYGNVE